MVKSKIIHPCKIWEKNVNKSQIEIRDNIENEAKKLNLPPSIHEHNLIKEGKLKSNWTI